jgi:hypothetical protein
VTSFKITPIDTQVVKEVRHRRTDGKYEHPVWEHVAVEGGFGPCRYCLRQTRPGEGRLLFTFDPFDGIEKFGLPGPVYVHTDCERYSEPGFPPDLKSLSLSFEAYGPERNLISVVRYENSVDPDPVISDLLRRPGVEYLHIRNTFAGCYVALAEAQGPQPSMD